MQTGTILGSRYRILQTLGRGYFGETYLAEDGDLPGKPRCVVKHLKPQQSNAIAKAKELFEREAKTLYKLGKKNEGIPELFAYFEEGGEFYLVQEYIDGEDLSKELTPGKQWGESEVRKLLVGILEALEPTHRENVIHRDIKPQNLMRRRENGKIVLIDFGAVKELSANPEEEVDPTQIGTRGYMPSEQWNGKPKLSSDIYAVGMVGIQALTGVSPEQLLNMKVVWRDRASVSKELGDILEKMVCDDFSRRYQNATEALAALRNAPPLKSTVILSPPPPPKATTTQSFTTAKVSSQGRIIKRLSGQAEVLMENLGSGVTLEMVSISGSRFLMGAPESELKRYGSESSQHSVNVPPFFLGKYPVMQAQYQAVMGNNPSYFKGANCPVETVTWNGATEFCQKLSQRTGKIYRLPSEAEWEYACRAGTTTPFYFGETITAGLVNYDGNYTYGSGPKGIYRQETKNVGSFTPNAFGLYGMHGNVWEWCQDVWHENYNGAPTDGGAWESAGDSSCRILRGGSWDSSPGNCRSACRNRNDAGLRDNRIGFRIVLVPDVSFRSRGR